MADKSAGALLEIENLSIALPPGADRAAALASVSLSLAEGETLCVVGESGSGKSVLASAILRLLPPGLSPTSGQIRLCGVNLLGLSESEMRRLRGSRIGMVFQDPMAALNPLQTIGAQIGEMFRLHRPLPRLKMRASVLSLLEEVGLPQPDRAMGAYPHQLSGGQRQRAMIAMALALEPPLLIADEPTTALDVTTQARILALLRALQRRRGTGLLFITHDFGVVAQIADRVTVMQTGRIVEQGHASEILRAPSAPYTRLLLASVPALRPGTQPLVDGPSLLRVKNVSKRYDPRLPPALRDVSLCLPRGASLGIVGESGSGKSTLARCIVGLLQPDSGSIMVDGEKPSPLGIQMVFQDPFASLNPRRRVGDLVAQGPVAVGESRARARARAERLLGLVGLPPAAMGRFPHEFSGGQIQRIALARALALEPKVLVADEPVSALDVLVQAQVLELLATLRKRLGLSLLFITHDLRVAAMMCDRVAVMQGGLVVEHGPTAEVFTTPQHEYTRTLLASVLGARASLLTKKELR
jgi:peptide/nickel transport system ATP-binding protein